MAYGNWGGKVYCDGNPLYNHCDKIPTNILKINSHDEELHRILSGTYHAIVGSDLGILALLYKNYIAYIFLNGNKIYEDNKFWVEVSRVKRAKGVQAFRIGDIVFEIKQQVSNRSISIEFKDFFGRHWQGCSGEKMGIGYEVWQ